MRPPKRFTSVLNKVCVILFSEESMKKLLEKMVQDRQESTTKEGEFERRLDAILKRYKITNLSFAAEIANLHKKY